MISIRPDEKVIFLKHRYWLPFAAETVSLIILAVLPLLPFLFVGLLPVDLQAIVNRYTLPYLFLATAWFFVLWVVFFVFWTNYYLDVLILTDQRLIDVEQIGLFARDIAEMQLQHIQDIRYEIIGFLPSLLNYGTIHIQTAGESKEFVIKNIENPRGICDLVSKCHAEALRAKQDPTISQR